MDYSHLYRQLDDANTILARLRKERTGLEDFEAEVRRGMGEASQQITNKRQSASRIAAIQNSGVAAAFGASLLHRFSPAYQSNTYENFLNVLRDVQRAIAEVDREIKHQTTRIKSLEAEVSQIRWEEERRRLERSRQL